MIARLNPPEKIGLIIFICCCLLQYRVSCQSIDSLINVLETGVLSDKQRLALYDEISWGSINSDVQRALSYGLAGQQLARQVGDRTYEALFLRNIGVAYYMKDSFDTALHYLDTALHLAKDLADEVMVARVYMAQANTYLQTSKYNQAIEIYLNALRLYEKAGMNKEVGKLYHNMGVAYQRVGNMDKALSNFEKSRDIAVQVADLHSLGFLNMAISNIYMESDPPRALQLANEALYAFEQHDNTFGEVMAILTIAQCYYFDQKYDDAFTYAQRGREMAEQSDFPKLKLEAIADLSNIHYHQGNYRQADALAEQALAMDTTNSDLTNNLLANVVRANIYLGNDEKAIQYLDRYKDHLQRFANESYQESLSEQEIKYETEKKELKIQTLETERRLFMVLIGLTVLATLALIAYFINRHKLMNHKQQLVQEKLTRAEQEKELIATQASLEGETAERGRLARDLHDGLGSMLSVVKLSMPPISDGAVIGKEDVRQVDKALYLLDQSIRELRRIAHHMMPESLIRLGLKDSLADFCRSNDKVKFQYFGDPIRMDGKLEILVYRAVHELVTNALKHAEASEIKVQLIQEPSRVSVAVQDNGAGFDVNRQHPGMGLTNLEYRVKTFNGHMDVYSSQKGTEVYIEFQRS